MKRCLKCNHTYISGKWICPVCNEKVAVEDDIKCFSPDLAKDSNGFDSDLFTKLFSLESNNFWFKSRNKLIIWALKRFFPKAGTIFEIGCGTGFVLSEIERQMSQIRLYGSDIFINGIKYCSKRIKNVELFQMDARQIPYIDEFDVIAAFDVLEHIDEDETVLAQIYNALNKDGGVIFTVPQHKFLWSQADEYSCHVRRYSSQEIINKMHNNGFKVIKVFSFVSLLMPLMMISRIFNKKRYNPMDEYKISNLLNEFFYIIMTIERFLIKAGITFPFGGSLLIIGKKLPFV